ncbi:MAG: hypothetical protein KDD63_26105, partial [Bacteroidetes bacterium]|nr:hypothetical protein [Bacteroidota bacterium]
MEHQEITKKIKSLIGSSKIEKAIIATKCIVIDKDYARKISLISRKYSETSEFHLLGIMEGDKLSVSTNKVALDLLKIVEILPDDFELLKRKIHYEASNQLKIESAISIFKECLNERNYYKIQPFERRFKEIQDRKLVEGNLDESTLNDLISDLEDLKNQFLEYVESVNVSFLKNDFSLRFFEKALTDRNFEYKEPISKSYHNSTKYFNDIKKADDKIRTYLLLWEEEYISGNAQESLNFVNRLRTEIAFDNSLIYEYTALSFLASKKNTKIINQVLVNKDNSDFEKLKLYIIRAISLDGESLSHENSMNYIFDELFSAIEKIYNNINFDHIINEPERGRSKRRNIIKRIFEVAFEINDLFKDYSFSKDGFIFKVLLELDGGGKYNWLSLREGKIKNQVNFDAVEYRAALVKNLFSD